jgi:hypothetical protein
VELPEVACFSESPLNIPRQNTGRKWKFPSCRCDLQVTPAKHQIPQHPRRIVNQDSIRRGPSEHSARQEARYANFFQIGHNACEFLLEFGQRKAIHTRIYVSPHHAQLLSDLLIETLEQHRQLALAAGEEAKAAGKLA